MSARKALTKAQAKPATKKRASKPVICAGQPPRLSGGKWTKRDGKLFGAWWQRREQTDALELRLTDWSDIGSPRKGGIRSLGDIFMMTAGVAWSTPGQHTEFHTIFHAIAAELEVMAEAEMGKRAERQKKLDSHASSDLFGPLSYLAQRLHAMGEIMPRIIKANYVHRSEVEAGK